MKADIRRLSVFSFSSPLLFDLQVDMDTTTGKCLAVTTKRRVERRKEEKPPMKMPQKKIEHAL